MITAGHSPKSFVPPNIRQSGQNYSIDLDIHQLELIGAMLAMIQPGGGVYSQAAMQLITLLDYTSLGNDFCCNSYTKVDPQFLVLDDFGTVVSVFPGEDITIQV